MAAGYADDNCLPTTGGVMTGPITMQGNPPYTLVQNTRIGTLTLNGTTPVTVATTQITSASYVFLTAQPGGSGTPGSVSIASITPGTGFAAVSTQASDARVIAWMIVDHG